MAESMRIINPPKTPSTMTTATVKRLAFPSISSFELKWRHSKRYPAISVSLMSGQNQNQRQKSSLGDLSNSSRKGEVLVDINRCLSNCLTETNLLSTVPGLKSKTRGKVRDIYDAGDYLVLVTTDRMSAFDRILASIPFKGQVLNETSLWWFNNTQHITLNAIVASPDKNVTIAKKCSVFPVEFVGEYLKFRFFGLPRCIWVFFDWKCFSYSFGGSI